MQRTKIEYLTHTWNPLAMRCTRVSAGCANCWHLRMAHRLNGVFSKKAIVCKSERLAKKSLSYSGCEPYLEKQELCYPTSRRKPSVIGVQFMGDLFHSSVTDEQIAAIFGVMAACPQHTFMVLTKRPDRMIAWFKWKESLRESPWDHHAEILIEIGNIWPLPNVWLGVSVEDQSTADERIPLLLNTPAAKRFVSCEPLLGPVDLCNLPFGKFGNRILDCLRAGCKSETPWGLNLVIAGAETGPGKRPMNIEWARSLRDQCAEADVPFFFKVDSAGNHELDGRLHEEMPEIGGKG